MRRKAIIIIALMLPVLAYIWNRANVLGAYNECLQHIHTANYAEAEKAARRQLLFANASMAGRKELGDLYQTIGWLDLWQYKLDEAAANLKVALKYHHGSDTVSDLSGLTSVYDLAGDSLQAESAARSALKTAVSAHPIVPADVRKASIMLARTYAKEGKLTLAKKYMEPALSLSENADQSGTVELTHVMGTIADREGDYAKAEKLHRKALDEIARLPSDQRAMEGRSLTALGRVLLEESKFAEADQCFQKALDADQHNFQSEDPAIARDLASFAKSMALQGKGKEAEGLFKRIFAIDVKYFGAGTVLAARDEFGRGEVARLAGNLPDARRYLLHALALERKILGEEHIYVADTYTELAKVAMKEGDGDGAKRYEELAHSVTKRLDASVDPEADSLLEQYKHHGRFPAPTAANVSRMRMLRAS